MSLKPWIVEEAIAHGGYLSRRMLEARGMSPSAIDRLVRGGDLLSMTEGVFRVVRMEGVEALLHGAVLALPGAVVSHEGAAALHGFPVIRPWPVVSVHSRTTHRFPGVTVRRTFDLEPDHRTIVRGFPVTTVVRTVVDLAAVIRPRRLDALVEELVLERKLDLGEVGACLAAVARRGKPGVTALREVLEGRSAGVEMPPTRLERLGLEAITATGLPMPAVQVPAPWDSTRRVDAAYLCCRVAIEWDSRRWHTARERFEADRRRDRAAAITGWVVLRFTWKDVTRDPQRVAGEIRAALATRDHVSHVTDRANAS